MAIEYEKNPKWWWQDEKLHTEYKEELKELKDKYKARFLKKHPNLAKKKKHKKEDE